MTDENHLVKEVDACVERICDLGCGMVYVVIERMERGEEVPELSNTSEEIKHQVLSHLKAIMAVYDARDGGASCKIDIAE